MSEYKHSHLTKANYFLILISFFFVSLLLYAPTLKADFLSDDWTFLRVATGRPLTASSYFLKNATGQNQGGIYRPLVSLSFWLNYKISGLTAWPYHLLNILLHALNAWLLFILVSRLSGGQRGLSGLAALFFLILPSQSETVAWLSARGDLLAATFFLAALFAYVSFRQSGRRLIFWLSLLAFSAALLAKEAAMSLPIIVVATEIFLTKSYQINWRRRIFYLIPYFILLGLYFFLRFYATGIFWGFYASPNLKFNPGSWLFNFFSQLAAFFSYGQWRALAFSFIAAHRWLSRLMVGVFLISSIAWVKQHRLLVCLAWSFFGLAILPVLSLPLERFDGASERFTYLPSVGLAMILALVLTARPKIFSKIACVVLITYFVFFARERALVWQQAGEISQNILSDFSELVDFSKKQGVVILGLPDSLNGAFIWRNGFFQALSLVYPNYQPDVLIAQPKLKLSSQQSIIDWQKEGGGKFSARPSGSATGFFGPPFLSSPDYQMRLTNYQSVAHAGDGATWQFTPAFLAQLDIKKIIFLGYNQGKLVKLPWPADRP